MVDPDHPYIVITPEQKRDGYFERRGFIAYPRRFHIVRQLTDGNFLALTPVVANFAGPIFPAIIEERQ